MFKILDIVSHEVLAFRGSYTVYVGSCLRRFGTAYWPVVQEWRIPRGISSDCLDSSLICWPLKMGQAGFPEISVNNWNLRFVTTRKNEYLSYRVAKALNLDYFYCVPIIYDRMFFQFSYPYCVGSLLTFLFSL
jgi:hypothetical protein